MTLKKIAALAGVSVSTVSKVINNSKEISEETSKRVREILSEKRYFEDKRIRGLENKKIAAASIAILCPEIISVHYSAVATRLCEMIRQRGGHAAIYICGFEPSEVQAMFLQCVHDESVDGILSLASLDCRTDTYVPVVTMCESKYYDSVLADLYDAILEAVEYLKKCGHKKIGFIGEKFTKRKEEYFHQAMAEAQLTLFDDYIYCSNARFEEVGREAAEQMANAESMPSACIAAYDEVAMGAIKEFERRKISVPDDISIIGINDIPLSAYTNLTTIRNNIDEMCRICMDLLYRRIEDRAYRIVKNIKVKCDFVIRETTKSLDTEK